MPITTDPYSQSLAKLMEQLRQQGVTGPSSISFGLPPSPQYVQEAYQTAFGSLVPAIQRAYAPLLAPGAGQVPESEILRYFGATQGPIREAVRQQAASAQAEAGFGPGTSGGGEGPLAEQIGRLMTQYYTLPLAQALMGAATSGVENRYTSGREAAREQTGALRTGATQYFGALTPTIPSRLETQKPAAGTGLHPDAIRQRMADPWAQATAQGGGLPGSSKSSARSTSGAETSSGPKDYWPFTTGIWTGGDVTLPSSYSPTYGGVDWNMGFPGGVPAPQTGLEDTTGYADIAPKLSPSPGTTGGYWTSPFWNSPEYYTPAYQSRINPRNPGAGVSWVPGTNTPFGAPR